MPDAIITSTASTFGTISGTFAADQSTIVGTVAGSVVGNLSGSVGVPGPAGPGVPAGGTAGQYLQKIDGVDYNTDWVTLNLSAYAPLNSPAFTGNPTAPTAALGDNDTSLATTAFVQQELASGTAVAKNLEVYVRNQTGSTLAAGAIVYINGATGNRPTVTLAQANNDANSAQTFGFVKTAIANNGFGYVIVRGELENIDTSALTEGVQLYLSPTTPGAWTTTKPSAPQHLVYVGIVVRSHPTQGVILVAVQNGYELDELHDVSIVSKANNDLIAYDSATTLWKNKSIGTLGLATQAWVDAQGYLQAGALTGYALESWVTAGFYPLTGNPSGFLTSAALTGYATESFVTSQGYITSSALSPYLLSSTAASTYQTLSGMSSYLTTSTAASTYYPLTNPSGYIGDAPVDGSLYARRDASWEAVSIPTPYITSVSSPLSVISGDLSIDLSSYLTSATAASLYYPLTNPDGYITSAALSGYATESWVTSLGYITSSALTPYATKASPALTGNVTITTNSTSPALVITQDGTGDVIQFKDVTSDTTYSFIDQNGKVGTIASTTTNAGFNIPHGTAPTSPVNGDIWTTTSGLLARINGSTVQFPSLNGSNTFGGSTNTFSGTSLTFGNSTAASTINVGTGATVSGSTKAVNIGTSGVAGSTTNITIGSTTGTSTTTLQGITNGVTQSAGDSSLKLATTAFVTTADNLKANLASPTFTGTPAAPTAAADTNTTQLATTAFVVGQAGSATPLVNGTAAVGTSLRYARQDHVHGTDTTRAPLASPALTGTPTAPTATAGTNTTQIATTAFVTAAVPAAATHIQSLQFSSTSAYTRVIDASSQLIAPSALKIWPSPSNLNGTSTSGAGAAANQSITGYTLISPSAGVAGNARCFFGQLSQNLGDALWGATSGSQINFSRRVSMAFRFNQFPSSTSSVTRVLLGKIHGTAVGDLTSRGIGVKYVPNGANFDFQLQVHNGTTLTSVTSSTQYAGGVADLEVVSDGAGNAVLYLNGAQVASTTGAPTGTTSANATVFAEIESQATTANQPSASIGRLTVNTLNF